MESLRCCYAMPSVRACTTDIIRADDTAGARDDYASLLWQCCYVGLDAADAKLFSESHRR